MFFDVILCILKDFTQPVFYLGVIVLTCLYAMGIRFGIRMMAGKPRGFTLSSRGFFLILLLVYLLVLLQTALFSREPGSRHSIDLTLFETWGHSAVSHAYFIENILMYVPFGILMPLSFRKMEHFWICVPVAGMSSILLELTQLVTQRGYCQLDDVVTNTMGAWIGWCIWCVLYHHRNQKKKQKERKVAGV